MPMDKVVSLVSLYLQGIWNVWGYASDVGFGVACEGHRGSFIPCWGIWSLLFLFEQMLWWCVFVVEGVTFTDEWQTWLERHSLLFRDFRVSYGMSDVFVYWWSLLTVHRCGLCRFIFFALLGVSYSSELWDVCSVHSVLLKQIYYHLLCSKGVSQVLQMLPATCIIKDASFPFSFLFALAV